jgi:hypothetical protein
MAAKSFEEVKLSILVIILKKDLHNFICCTLPIANLSLEM